MPEHIEWRPVPGYEGWYEASRCGRVRRLRAIYNGRGLPREQVKELAPLWYRKGYRKVQFNSCGGTREPSRQYIHRVIYRTFHGEIPDGLTVNHKDGTHDNNHADNLELLSQQEQHTHARALGLLCHRTKTGLKAPTLTKDDVLAIREAIRVAMEKPTRAGTPRKRPFNIETLAREYGVVPTTISAIWRRIIWKHI